MEANLRVSRILWAAFMMSQLTIPVVAFVVERPPEPPEPLMLPVMAVVALALAVTSLILPARLFAAALRQLKLEVSEEVDADPSRFGAFYRNAAGKQRVFTKPQRALARGFAPFQVQLILSIALSEAVTLFGLVLAMLGFAPVAFVPFFATGGILVALRFPQLSTLRNGLEQAYGASLGARSE